MVNHRNMFICILCKKKKKKSTEHTSWLLICPGFNALHFLSSSCFVAGNGKVFQEENQYANNETMSFCFHPQFYVCHHRISEDNYVFRKYYARSIASSFAYVRNRLTLYIRKAWATLAHASIDQLYRIEICINVTTWWTFELRYICDTDEDVAIADTADSLCIYTYGDT